MPTPFPTEVARPEHRAGSWSLAGTDLERFRFEAGENLPPHEHDRAAVILLLAGAYRSSDGRREHACESGDVLVLPAGLRHAETIGPAGSRAIVVRPSSPREEQPAALWRSGPRVVRERSMRGLVWRLASACRVSAESDTLGVEEALVQLLAVLEGTALEGREVPSSALRRARDLVEEAPEESLSLDELARRVGVSRVRLTRQFRRAYGTSVAAYRRQVRLDRAAALLRSTGRSLGEVALAAGFYDQSHLTNAFRRGFGCTPAEFREAQRRPVRTRTAGGRTGSRA